MGERGTLTLLVGIQTGAATWKTVWSFLKKLKIELPYDPTIALLGVSPKDINIVIQRGTCTLIFMAAVSTIAKLGKETRCPLTDEWIKKMWCGGRGGVCVMEYYSAIKKNETLLFAMMWMELEDIMLNKMSQRKTNTI